MPVNQSLERLMSDYGDAIFRMCFLYLKDYQLAEDAVQETFIKAMSGYEKFEHRAAEKTWLTRIAINCCKNILRTHWFRVLKNPVAEPEELRNSDGFDEKIAEKSGVVDAVMKLERNDREIILLYYYQELSVREIASVIKISENAVNQRLYRARKRLKKLLTEVDYEF